MRQWGAGIVVVVVLAGRTALAVPEACTYPDATAKDIHLSDVYRADDVVGAGLARVRERISPDCRKALDAGAWPELADLLAKAIAKNDVYKRDACLIAPPELAPAITTWMKGATPVQGYYVECAVALFHARRADFEAVVAPLLVSNVGLAISLGTFLRPEERSILLPTLEAATRDHVSGRDWVFSLACVAEPARSAAHAGCPGNWNRIGATPNGPMFAAPRWRRT